MSELRRSISCSARCASGRVGPAPVRRLAADDPQGRPHAAARSGGAGADAARTSCTLLAPIMPEKNRKEYAERHDTDFAYEIPELARFRVERLRRSARARRGVPRHPVEDPDRRAARTVAAHPAAVQAEQGAGARHRADRLGQVDDAVRDDRPRQPDARRITSSRSRIRSSSCTRTRSA